MVLCCLQHINCSSIHSYQILQLIVHCLWIHNGANSFEIICSQTKWYIIFSMCFDAKFSIIWQKPKICHLCCSCKYASSSVIVSVACLIMSQILFYDLFMHVWWSENSHWDQNWSTLSTSYCRPMNLEKVIVNTLFW